MEWTKYELAVIEESKEVIDSGNLFDIVSELNEVTSGHSYLKIIFSIVYLNKLFDQITFNIYKLASDSKEYLIDIFASDFEIYSLTGKENFKNIIFSYLVDSVGLDEEIVNSIISNSTFVENLNF